MAEDRLETLRRLARTHRITFRAPSDEWPAAHRVTFNDIETAGNHKFDSYQEIVGASSAEKPWTKQTKARAEWLAKRASTLFGQRRNEAGWRLGLENDVLRRFSVEVACPNCRARVWRSEVEATLNDDSNYGQRLEQRRKERKPCDCLPANRPDDFYEIGTNALFDDRAQELIVHNDVSNTQIPRQEPDRIFGLRTTKNFEDLVSRPVAASPNVTLADHIRMCPFKKDSDPLLFPFLLLEAKSETSSNGFDDIQVQSALPLWALLKLQEELQSHRQENEPQWHPLDIVLLWSGSLMHKDHALQLIHIVDTIFDWARDIYRPTILRQLKSIATSTSFDQVSLIDSDVHSMRGSIPDWIRGLPNTSAEDLPDNVPSELESGENPSIMPQEHQSLLPVPIPNTSGGTVRSAFLSDFRFVSLYLTGELVLSLLQLIEARSQGGENTTFARQIVNFITQFDEILVLTGADLDQLEATWTGTIQPNNAPVTEEFYVVMEASSYLSPSWDIIREISCLAVSKPAFDFLVSVSSFVQRHQGIKKLPQKQRTCSGDVLKTCIECLRSGSPWQVLLSAISCTLVAFHPLPERRRPDIEPPVEVLGLAYIRFSRVKLFIQRFLKMDVPGKKRTTKLKRQKLDNNLSLNPTDLSFKRISHKRTCIAQEREHVEFECNRCFQNGEKVRSPHGFLDRRIQPVLSDYHAILVVALGIVEECFVNAKLDVCLFAFDMPTEFTGGQVLPLIVKDLAQADMVYHAIHHELLHTPHRDGILWNLPLPYRSKTRNEHLHMENWIRELHDQPADESDQDIQKPRFDVTQMLLFCLSIGYTYPKAKVFVQSFISGRPHPCYQSFCEKFPNARRESQMVGSPSSRPEVRLHGGGVVRGFTSWDEGERHLREYTLRQPR
ncbi:hypothetical protein FQN54_002133 [Arachnomyces sp. PD_36]|nr:hypothetical protein FQN54_002133 [Arachnomyces sp. PD_36]